MIKIIENKLLKWIGVEKFISIQIDITNLCNLTCSHCYHPHHNNKGALSLNDWINVLDEYEIILNKINAKAHVIICGGEPFTSPLLKPILENLLSRSRKFHLSILTNGTILERFDLSIFKKFDNVNFQISLDGPNEELHDSFRGKGSFQKALLGIKKLKKENLNVTLQSVLTKKTSMQIYEFFNLASMLKVSNMDFTRLIVIGHAESLISENIDNVLKPLELKVAYENILINSSRVGINTDTEIPLMTLIHPSLGKKHKFHEGIVIDYQGYVLASSRSRFKMENIKDKKLSYIFFNSIQRKHFKNSKIDECSECPVFKNCGGDRNASFATHNDFFRKDPACWIKDINQIA